MSFCVSFEFISYGYNTGGCYFFVCHLSVSPTDIAHVGLSSLCVN